MKKFNPFTSKDPASIVEFMFTHRNPENLDKEYIILEDQEDGKIHVLLIGVYNEGGEECFKNALKDDCLYGLVSNIHDGNYDEKNYCKCTRCLNILKNL
jgi:hypothetical protein